MCFHFFLCHGQLGQTKSSEKTSQAEAAADRQHVNQAHALVERKNPQKGEKELAHRGSYNSATKCLHLATRAKGEKGWGLWPQTNRLLDVTAAPSYENKINVSQCGSREVALCAPHGALLWSKECTEKYSYLRINPAQQIFKIVKKSSLLLIGLNIYQNIYRFSLSMWA